jgi:uncharacterized membrane protein YphA (DoxX/SURF4 family)
MTRLASHVSAVAARRLVDGWNFLHDMLSSPRLYFFVRVTLALVFIYAGLIKLADTKAFARTVSQYGLLPEPLLPVVAVSLPSIEALAGCALVFDLGTGLYAISGLLLLFASLLGYGVLKNMDIDCGCFGPAEIAEHKGLTHAFLRDLALIGVVAFLQLSRFARRQSLSIKPIPKST